MVSPNRQIEDALLANDTALPNAASTTVTTAVLDMDASSQTGSGMRLPNVEVAISIPALSATIIPNTRTYTVSIEASNSATFASGVETLRSVTVTGAGSTVAAFTLQDRVPADGPRYYRGKVVSGASTTDASALSAHFAFKF